MTLIEDMSESQRQAWITLIVDITVFLVFLKGMLKNYAIETLSAQVLSQFIISLIAITIILHIVIQSIFAARLKLRENPLKDERDLRIQRKGASYGFWVLAILINILIGHIVIQNGLNMVPEISSNRQFAFDYTNTSHLVFALIFIVYLADIIKNAVMVQAYRGG